MSKNSEKKNEVFETAEIEENDMPFTEEFVDDRPEEINGVVANCQRLNVRRKPKANAGILCVIDVKSKVTIDMDKSTEGWFRVTTTDGVDGFCMKQFITVDA